MSSLHKNLSKLFIFLTVVLLITAWTLIVMARSSCESRPAYHWTLAGYELNMDLRRTDLACPDVFVE